MFIVVLVALTLFASAVAMVMLRMLMDVNVIFRCHALTLGALTVAEVVVVQQDLSFGEMLL
mgnify:CR=1 FL=1